MAKRTPREPYTEADETKLMALKQDGKSFDEIANILGRKVDAVRSKWYLLNHRAKRANSKKLPKIPRAAHIPKPQAPRPMIALIGPTNEVTATIRELFS